MKPRIFIGSSSEGLKIAQKVKTYFEKEYECFLWTDGIFKFNENFQIGRASCRERVLRLV